MLHLQRMCGLRPINVQLVLFRIAIVIGRSGIGGRVALPDTASRAGNEPAMSPCVEPLLPPQYQEPHPLILRSDYMLVVLLLVCALCFERAADI